MTKRRVRIIVRGIVQGVGFRAETKYVVKRKIGGITGYVRNLDTGEVEIVAEGSEENLKKLIEWAKKGPPQAKVESIDYEFLPFTGEFQDFLIRYD